MATDQSLLGGNLGKVQETYGGKSVKRIVAVSAAVFGCGLAFAILIRMFWPDYRVTAIVFLGGGVVIALANVSQWSAALAKVEICEGGVRLHRRNGVTDLPWDQILKVEVGEFRQAKGKRAHAVIWTTDGKAIELPSGFWAAVGTSRLATTLRRFVEDVEEDVEFTTFGGGVDVPGEPPHPCPVFDLWFGAVFPPCFLGIFAGMTFAVRADDPAWETWVARVVVTLFGWLVSSVSAGFAFRALRRRGTWLPLGAKRWPWPAAAAYAAVVLFIATVVIVGFVVCLELVFGTQGRTNG